MIRNLTTDIELAEKRIAEVIELAEARALRNIGMLPKPTRTVRTGVWTCWCPACDQGDFNHDHPGDDRCAVVGEPWPMPTHAEVLWVKLTRHERGWGAA